MKNFLSLQFAKKVAIKNAALGSGNYRAEIKLRDTLALCNKETDLSCKKSFADEEGILLTDVL